MSLVSSILKGAARYGGAALLTGNPAAGLALATGDLVKATSGGSGVSANRKGLSTAATTPSTLLAQVSGSGNPWVPSNMSYPSAVPTFQGTQDDPYTMPVTTVYADGGGCHRPMFLDAQPSVTYRPRKGYVIVDQGQASGGAPNGLKVQMLKGCARALGLYHARPKPPIKASEWRQLKTAARVEKKLQGIGKMVGMQKKSTRCSCKTTTRTARKR